MIPGSNILATALTVIGSTPVSYFQRTGETTGPTGLNIVTYAAPVTIARGSVQPVDRQRYEQNGLDWSKQYVTWYVPNVATVTTINRRPDGSGDVIEVNGRRYQCMSDNPWFKIDGWTAVLCIDIGPATGATTNA